MDREEILAKSRGENRGVDEMEQAALLRAGKIASQAGMLLCCLIAVAEVAVKDRISCSSWMIYFCILTATFAVKYRALRRTHELILTILYGSLFLMFTALFVLRLSGVMA